MKKNRKGGLGKERLIMIGSSVFVMAALTMTGMYLKGRNVEQKDGGYSLDLAALDGGTLSQARGGWEEELQNPVTEDDLDYDPGSLTEVDSGLVTIPGLTDKTERVQEEEDVKRLSEETQKEPEIITEKDPVQKEEPEQSTTEGQKEAGSDSVVVKKELHFEEQIGLIRPVQGEVLLPYSMDKSIYFQTLDQYKYNPAMVFQAAEGDTVAVCSDALVLSVFENEEIGKAVKLDIGDGYQVICGQLQDINAVEGGYVNRGEVLGTVAAPTKYYSLEGANVYFQLYKDGVVVNPEEYFQK